VAGSGVEKNEKEAAIWIRKASDQGSPRAQGILGKMYAVGTGVPQNDAEAFRLYKRAAAAGDRDAQASLGMVYLLGKGTVKDPIQAYVWSSVAADAGVDAAKDIRTLAEKELTSAQLAGAKKLVQDRKGR